tara:strand:- start:5 stop:262 length:258 start_codon:yes stop_codon:yes gene_type:complete
MTSKNEKIDPWQDNTEAHEVINMCLKQLGEKVENIEKNIQELPTFDKVFVKNDKKDEYVHFIEIIKDIYERLDKIEQKLYNNKKS